MNFFYILTLFFTLESEAGARKVISELNDKMDCPKEQFIKGQLNCKYFVENSIEIEIAGVGQKDASIYFHKVNKDKYFVKFLISSQCIMIKSNSLEQGFAFISIKDGKVYPTWESCPRI